MRRNGRKTIPVLRAGLVLAGLTLATLFMATGLYARYRSEASSADGARVASFEIESGVFESSGGGLVESAPFAVTMYPNGEQTRLVTVHNKSEVAVECTVTAVNESCNLPLELEWSEETVEDAPLSASGAGSHAEGTETLAVGSGKQTYTLHIRWPETENSVSLQKELDHIIVTIRCEQID